MNNLIHGTQLYARAIEYEETHNFVKAFDYYNACVQCLILAEKYEDILLSSKDEIRKVLSDCYHRINELKKFIEQSNHQSVPQVLKHEIIFNDGDQENILKCIKSTVRTDASDTSFENIYGLSSVINELEQTVLLQINNPSLFAEYVKPYNGFLLYGVKIVSFSIYITENDFTYTLYLVATRNW